MGRAGVHDKFQSDTGLFNVYLAPSGGGKGKAVGWTKDVAQKFSAHLIRHINRVNRQRREEGGEEAELYPYPIGTVVTKIEDELSKAKQIEGLKSSLPLLPNPNRPTPTDKSKDETFDDSKDKRKDERVHDFYIDGYVAYWDYLSDDHTFAGCREFLFSLGNTVFSAIDEIGGFIGCTAGPSVAEASKKEARLCSIASNEPWRFTRANQDVVLQMKWTQMRLVSRGQPATFLLYILDDTRKASGLAYQFDVHFCEPEYADANFTGIIAHEKEEKDSERELLRGTCACTSGVGVWVYDEYLCAHTCACTFEVGVWAYDDCLSLRTPAHARVELECGYMTIVSMRTPAHAPLDLECVYVSNVSVRAPAHARLDCLCAYTCACTRGLGVWVCNDRLCAHTCACTPAVGQCVYTQCFYVCALLCMHACSWTMCT